MVDSGLEPRQLGFKYCVLNFPATTDFFSLLIDLIYVIMFVEKNTNQTVNHGFLWEGVGREKLKG